MSNSKLYVGNLSFKTTEDELRSAFGQFGSVTDVYVAMDKMTGRPRGFAFVTMGTADEAKQAAEKAIALDPQLADGYSALGFALFYGFKDLRRAETLFQKALALDPTSGRTFHWYALIMMHTGKF